MKTTDGREFHPCHKCGSLVRLQRSTFFRQHKICMLACGHSWTFPLDPDEIGMVEEHGASGPSVTSPQRKDEHMLGVMGAQRECPACGESFKTWNQTVWGAFCGECKTEMNNPTIDELEAFITCLDNLKPSEREEIQKGIQEMRKQKKRGWGVGREMRPTTPPPAPVDLMKVAEGVRSMVGYGATYPVAAADLQPTNYVIAANGLFEIRHTEVADIVLPVAKGCPTCKTAPESRMVIGLIESAKPGIHLNIPKLPYLFLSQTVALFRETCRRKGGSNEALVRIWWSMTERRWEIRVPQQAVSGASVSHRDDFDLDGTGGWLHVMDIHSHGSSMDAFWSSVDDADERRFPEGRMAGVIGKVNQPLPAWKWRMRTREGFVELNPADIFDLTGAAEVNIPFTASLDLIFRASANPANVREGSVSLACPVDPFRDATCPEEWHERVGHTVHQMGAGGGQPSFGDTDWRYRGTGRFSRVLTYRREGNRFVEIEAYDGKEVVTGKYIQLPQLGGPHVH